MLQEYDSDLQILVSFLALCFDVTRFFYFYFPFLCSECFSKTMGSGNTKEEDLAFCDECRAPIIDRQGVCVYCKTVRLCESCRDDKSLICLGQRGRNRRHRFETEKIYFCMSCKNSTPKEKCVHCDSNFTIEQTVLTGHHHRQSPSAEGKINGESLENELEFLLEILERHRIGYNRTVETSIDYEKFVQKGASAEQLRALRKVDSSNLNAEDKCSICLNGWRKSFSPSRRRSPVQIVSQLPCGHYFHGTCIRKWLNWRDSCPVCRNVLPLPDF